jgi:cobalt-precorrin 5A hydrolase
MKIALGLGCDRGTPAATIALCINEALAACGATLSDVWAVASIDLKADEPGLLHWPRQTAGPALLLRRRRLAAVDVPHPSETVRKYTGTPSVSEAAALLPPANADQSQLILEKHKLRGPDGRNATVSIARIAPMNAPENTYA